MNGCFFWNTVYITYIDDCLSSPVESWVCELGSQQVLGVSSSVLDTSRRLVSTARRRVQPTVSSAVMQPADRHY